MWPWKCTGGGSNAALGIVRRKGAGKLRHVRIGQLWVQDMRKREGVRFQKVLGKRNPADGGTKGVSGEEIAKYGQMLGYTWPEGRSKAAPKMAEGWTGGDAGGNPL